MKEALEGKARKFRSIVGEGRKKEALEYFNNLDEKSQRYIQTNPDYSWILKSARMQF